MDIQNYQPWFTQIRIENTNHCGYKCVMCPRDKHTRSQGIMPIEDFDLVLDRIGSFKGEMHLHGFGESLLDRSLPEKLQLVRKKLPSETKTVIISTLGVRTPAQFFYDLAEAKLNLIMVSCYGYSGEAYKKVHGRNAFHIVKENLEILSQVRKTSENFPEVRLVPSSESMLTTLSSKKDGRTEFLTWVESLGMRVVREQRLHNYGDGRGYNDPEQQLCPVIRGRRKSILQVTWDLNVIPCCYDYNASIVFGNLKEQSLEEIFTGPEYFQFVSSHLSSNLEQYKICQNCEKDLY